MTVGRHAAYEMMSAFPITSFGIADTGLLCPLLVRQAKKVDAIFLFSDIALCSDGSGDFTDDRLCAVV